MLSYEDEEKLISQALCEALAAIDGYECAHAVKRDGPLTMERLRYEQRVKTGVRFGFDYGLQAARRELSQRCEECCGVVF